MFLIAGLGNPGKEYENTRHNAGFMVLDALADKLGADISEKKAQGPLRQGCDRRAEGDPFKAPDIYEFQRREHPGGC